LFRPAKPLLFHQGNLFPFTALRQPYPSAPAVLRDELDAGFLEGALNRIPNVVGDGRPFVALALVNDYDCE